MQMARNTSKMILETAILNVRAGREAAFKIAMASPGSTPSLRKSWAPWF